MSKAKRNYVLAEEDGKIRMMYNDDFRLENLPCIEGKFIKNKGEDIPNSAEARQIGKFVGENNKVYIVFSNKLAQEI